MLNEVDRLLGLAEIEYAIVFGTALGYVRHASFIPWDDDMDIVVHEDAREDIIKLFANQSAYCTLPCGWTCSFKIFFCDGPKVPKWNWTYPYVDVFLATTLSSEDEYLYNFATIESSDFIDDVLLSRREMGFDIDQPKEHSLPSDRSFNDDGRNSEDGFEENASMDVFERWMENGFPNSIDIESAAFWRESSPEDADQSIEKQIIFPSQRVKFAGIYISAPQDVHTHLKIIYGNDYRETCKANSYDHAQETLRKNHGREQLESCEMVLKSCSHIYKDFFHWTLK